MDNLSSHIDLELFEEEYNKFVPQLNEYAKTNHIECLKLRVIENGDGELGEPPLELLDFDVSNISVLELENVWMKDDFLSLANPKKLTLKMCYFNKRCPNGSFECEESTNHLIRCLTSMNNERLTNLVLETDEIEFPDVAMALIKARFPHLTHFSFEIYVDGPFETYTYPKGLLNGLVYCDLWCMKWENIEDVKSDLKKNPQLAYFRCYKGYGLNRG